MTPTTNAVTPESQEAPLVVRPDVENWTENYCNQAYFPDSQIGIWTHLSHMPGPMDLWRDLWIAYLPGDRFLVAKGFGRGATDRGPGAGMLSLRFEEPFQRWTMTFSGGVREVTGEQLRAGAVDDGLNTFVELDLTWEASSPVFDFGQWMGGQGWASAHYEQSNRVSGRIAIGGERTELAGGTGIRDHSRGPRTHTSIRAHWWLTGQFPSGKSFALLELDNYVTEGGPLLKHALISDGKTVQLAEVVSVEMLEATEQRGPRRHRTTLRVDTGEEHVIEARVLQEMPFALGDPNEMILGAAFTPDASLALFESQTEYSWDGEIGYGLTERSQSTDHFVRR